MKKSENDKKRPMNTSLTPPEQDLEMHGRDYPPTRHERVRVDSGGTHKRPGYAAGVNEKTGFNPDPGTAAADEAAKFGDGGFPPAPKVDKRKEK